MERPWYIQQWEESYQRAIQTTFYDKDAEEFCKDFFHYILNMLVLKPC